MEERASVSVSADGTAGSGLAANNFDFDAESKVSQISVVSFHA